MSTVVRSPAFVLLAAVSCATVAHADIIRITATGTVHSTNMAAFASGQSMTTVFEYEPTGSPQLISNQQAFYDDHMRSINFSSDAWNTSATASFSVGWHTAQAEVVPTPGAGLLFAAALVGARRRRAR